jgi:hypothetical protein
MFTFERKNNMTSDNMIVQFLVKRGFQLRTLIAGHFLSQGIDLDIWVIDGAFGENEWLFSPGYGFRKKNGSDGFFLSTRGHTSRMQSHNPRDIVGWIQDDTRLIAVLSDKDDIIAYGHL